MKIKKKLETANSHESDSVGFFIYLVLMVVILYGTHII